MWVYSLRCLSSGLYGLSSIPIPLTMEKNDISRALPLNISPPTQCKAKQWLLLSDLLGLSPTGQRCSWGYTGHSRLGRLLIWDKEKLPWLTIPTPPVHLPFASKTMDSKSIKKSSCLSSVRCLLWKTATQRGGWIICPSHWGLGWRTVHKDQRTDSTVDKLPSQKLESFWEARCPAYI